MGLTFPRVSRIDRIILLFLRIRQRQANLFLNPLVFYLVISGSRLKNVIVKLLRFFLIQQPIFRPVPFLKYQICLVVNL